MQFTKAQVRRAIDAVEAAGKSVAAVEFLPSGGFRVVLSRNDQAAGPNEWDDVLETQRIP